MMKRWLSVMMVVVMIMSCTQNVYAAGVTDTGLVSGDAVAETLADGEGQLTSLTDLDDGKELPEDDSSFAEGDLAVSDDPAEGGDELLPEDDAAEDLPPDEEEFLTPDEELVEEIPTESLLTDSDHKHCVCGSGTSCGSDHTPGTEWTAWDSTTSLPTEAGYYYLTGNVTLQSNTTAEAGVYLCINGKTVDLNGYYYAGNGKLAITNCEGKSKGGFICSGTGYSSKPAISAKDLELHSISVSFSNMTGTVYGVGYKGNYGDQAYLLIDNCDISMTGSDPGYLVTAYDLTSVTMKDTTVTMTGANGQYAYGVNISGYTGKVTMSNCTVSVTGSSTGIIALGLTHSGNPEGTLSEVANISNCSFSAKTTSEATRPWPNFCTATKCTSGGAGYFTFDTCSMTSESKYVECHAFELECGVTYAYQGYAGKAVLNNCTATATSEGLAYALDSSAHLTMNGGSAIAAGTSDSAGLYIEGSYSGCEHILSGVAITGSGYGIYQSRYTNKMVSVDGCTITATDEDSYGIKIPYGPLYLGGNTQIGGNLGGIYKTLSGSYSPYTHCPEIYAYSYGNENNPLTIAGDKTITVYYGFSSPKTADLIINGGMIEALVGKLTMSYPEGFSIGADGKLVTPVQSSVNVEYNYQKGSGSAYKDAEYSTYLPSGKAFEGDTVYIEATPKTHFIFDGWDVKLGGVILADATAARTSFVMGASAVTVYANFKEAPYSAISYKGGNDSDGSVKDFADKKYEGETLKLATKVFKNKTASIVQTGWSTTDGGPKVYELGGDYETESALTLYPYWQKSVEITFNYGDFPSAGHSKNEKVQGTPLNKTPGQKFYLDNDYGDLFGYETQYTGYYVYQYIKDESGHVWKFKGLSRVADHTSADYKQDFVLGNDPTGQDRCYYTGDEDITLYPYMVMSYLVKYQPDENTKNPEAEAPDQIKDPGSDNTVKLYGTIDSSNIKHGVYESIDEWKQQGGWSTTKNGAKDYDLGATYSADADVTLYPYWETIYKVTYAPGPDGINPEGEKEIYHKKYINVGLNLHRAIFVRDGYIQSGWNTEPDGTGTSYNLYQTYHANKDLTLYPTWVETSRITYMPDEKCISGSVPVYQTKYPDVTAAFLPDVFTAKGYTLIGYNRVKGSTAIEYAIGDSYSTDENITVYPVWEPLTYALWIGDTQVTTANQSNVLGDEGTVSYDPDTGVLTLNNANITSFTKIQGKYGNIGIGIYAESDSESADFDVDRLIIDLSGTNVIDSDYADCVQSVGIWADDLVFTGSGNLTVGNDDPASCPLYIGVQTSSFKLKEATLNLYGHAVGLYANTFRGKNAFVVESGTLNVAAWDDGSPAVFAESAFDTAVVINGGTVNLKTCGNKKSEAEIPIALFAEAYDADAVEISGGTITLSNEGNAGIGILVSSEFSNQEMGGFQYYGIKYYAGETTITAKTCVAAMDVESASGVEFIPAYIDEGVTAVAGSAPEDASALTDYEVLGTCKYAKFTGGTVPVKTYLYVGETAVTSANLEGDGWGYDPATNTLTLDDLELDSVHEVGDYWTDKYGIYAEDDLNIRLTGSSSIGYGKEIPDKGIYCGGTLTVSGDGYLNVHGTGYGIMVDYSYIAEGGIVEADAEDYFALYAGFNTEFRGGTTLIDSKSQGINAEVNISVSGGVLDVKSQEDAVSCDNYIQSAGTVSLISTEDGNDNALVTSKVLTVTGGELYTEAYKCCIYGIGSGQYMNVSGGHVLVEPRSDKGSAIDYDYLKLMGGSLDIIGGYVGYYGTSNGLTVTGGSLLIDTTGGEHPDSNYASNGYINVNRQGYGYSTSPDKPLSIMYNTFNLNCRQYDYNYVRIAGVYAVSYRPGTGGSGDNVDTAKESGRDLELAGALFTKEGFMQDGWTLTDGGDKIYELGGTYSQDADVTFYPSWGDKVTITYKPGAAAGEQLVDEVARGIRVTLRGATYSMAGSIQTGWTKTADSTTIDYALGQEVTVEDNLVLYPVFASKYVITYEKGIRGKGETQTQDVNIGESAVLKDAIFTRAGYVQSGWSMEDGGEKNYELCATIDVEADTVLFPAWTRIEPEPVPGPDDKHYWIEFEGADKVYIGDTETPVYVLDYCGAAIKPVVSIYDGDELLKEKTDYTIAFKNNTNANMTAANLAAQGKAVTAAGLSAKELSKLPYVTVTGKGNYKQKETVYFAIRPKDISEGTDFAPEATDDYVFVYAEKKGKAVVNKPVPVVSGTVNGKTKKLAKTKEYTVRYFAADLDGAGNYKTGEDGLYMTRGEALAGISDEGKYVVRVDGNGNYAGSLTLKAQVTRTLTPIGKAKVTYAKNLPYDDGKPVQQTGVRVVLNKKELTKDTDYEISYVWGSPRQSGVPSEIGTYTMLITGKGIYAGTIPVKFNIVGTALSKVKQRGFVSAFTYNGQVQKQTGFVLYVIGADKQEKPLGNKDYEVKYFNASGKECEPIDAGAYTAVYTGKGAYSGSLSKKFKINPYDAGKDPNKWISASVDVDASGIEYSKGGTKPTITLKFRNEVVDSASYTLSYKNNTAVNDMSNAKKLPTVTATCKGNLKGKVTAGNFKIRPKDFAGLTFMAADKAYANKANNYTTTFIITDTDGNELKAGTDYDKSVVYRYDQDVEVINAKKPAARKKGDTVTKNDIVPVGTHMKAEIAPKGNYTGTPRVLSYEIAALDISKAKVRFAKDFYFERGTAIELTEDDFTLYYKNGRTETVIDPAQYEIIEGSHKDNLKAGNALFKVRGTGDTGGILTVKFKILPKWLRNLFG